MTHRSHRDSGFSLLEVVLAAGVAAAVLGGGALMYVNGTRGFTTASEHVAIRERSLLLLERISRDLEGLVVSHERNSRTGKHYMVEPYTLLEPGLREAISPVTGMRRMVRTARGIRFHVYHRTEIVRIEGRGEGRRVQVEAPGSDPETLEVGWQRLPRIVGRAIEWKARPTGEDSVDLYRNGVKVNREPLREVRFEKVDPIHTQLTMGASPHAVIRITVVPRVGMMGDLDASRVAAQDRDSGPMTRLFHLVGYESQYTALLGVALKKQARDREREVPKSSLDELERAILEDAEVYGILRRDAQRIENAGMAYRMPPDLVHIESHILFDREGAGDWELARAEVVEAPPLEVVPGSTAPGTSTLPGTRPNGSGRRSERRGGSTSTLELGGSGAGS